VDNPVLFYFFLLPHVGGWFAFSIFFLNCCCLEDKYPFWTIQMFSMFSVNCCLFVLGVYERQEGGQRTQQLPQKGCHPLQDKQVRTQFNSVQLTVLLWLQLVLCIGVFF
jgi:hypothetical protein